MNKMGFNLWREVEDAHYTPGALNGAEYESCTDNSIFPRRRFGFPVLRSCVLFSL